ncbi:hypothetical protein DRN67_03435 [Candidatus Micrarchaeota archaeon]|nr:MAG: hypothetical protein DRN67_03435 [Candidatus Micrarchaeota archaeon]
MERREIVLVLALLLLAIAIRLPGIERPLYGDEADWLKSAKIVVDGDERWPNAFVSDNPPLGKATYAFFYWLGFDNLRLVALLFGLATLLLAWWVTREFLGSKVGLVVFALLAVSVYHIVASQQVDRDGSMIAFLALLTMYTYMKYAQSASKSWLALSAAAFTANVLMRTTMLAAIVPLLAYDYAKSKKIGVKKYVCRYWPYAAGFALSFIIWAWLDMILGLPTLTMKTLLHYTEPLGYGLNERILRMGVAGARILARLTVPLAIALLVSLYYLRSKWSGFSSTAQAFLLANLAWIGIGMVYALLALRGDPPRYFGTFVPSIAIVVGLVATSARKVGKKWMILTALFTLAYVGVLGYMDFNEVNLLLMWVPAVAAFVVAAAYLVIDFNLNRLVAMLVVMSMATSAFMLTDYRTYDALRSHAVADATDYFNLVGAQKIAESQERTLDLYVEGNVEQYEIVTGQHRPFGQGSEPPDEPPHAVPAGYYVVDFPLKPLQLDPAVGAQFRFNLFDEQWVKHCEHIRTYEIHSIIVSEFYKC